MPKYPDVIVKLSGEDGNSMSIIARTRVALRKAKVSNEEITAFTEDAMSGDYDHTL